MLLALVGISAQFEAAFLLFVCCYRKFRISRRPCGFHVVAVSIKFRESQGWLMREVVD